MKKNLIESYVQKLERALWLKGLSNAEVSAEIEGHLREAVERGLQQGLSRDDAERQALKRFGSVKTVTVSFEKERNNTMQKILLAIAILFGLFIAYVDSRPTWDDTGITVGALVLASGLVTLLGYKRPWLSALAIGLWLPLYEIFRTYQFFTPLGMVLFPVLIILFAAVGAYGGWAIRLGFRKTFHMA